ncbi:prolyl oligopeptidase family serine peptidase [Taibaiella chishuiensis]|uniref:prolyl oligopeptidase n=1 Tax=Taibaiella chishuiensis TaxID=1434707 RepID=A0A2P8DBD2_9BACT|nr:prolyl oligopeptidase family serine peptidase [Taibaiella chishuiensis]PSK94536.1 prolyl oligopeptidase [Taibaiella chishuiensis]
MAKKSLPLIALSLGVSFGMSAQSLQYPHTRKVEQTDNYFGTQIADPYRWLENDTAKDTEAWVKEENTLTHNYLSKIPYRQKLHDRLTELWNYPRYSAPDKEGDWYTFYKNDGLQNQAVLYVQKGLTGTPEVLLDPNKLSTDGTVALQATAFSKKQKYFAYAASASGSDWQEIYVMDFQNRKLLSDKLEYVKFTGISWKGELGFYYSGYDRPKDEATKFSAKTEYQKVYFHRIGTPQSQDILIYEDREHPLRYVSGGLTEDERFLVLSISEGTDGSEIKVQDLTDRSVSNFSTIVPGFKTNASVVDNVGDKILLQTNSSAPNNKVVLLDPKNPGEANWKTIIPEQKETLEGVSTGGGKLFASYLKDAASLKVQYSLDGKLEHNITLPGVGTAGGFGCKKEDQSFFYSFTSFTYPPTIFKYDIQTGKSELFRKSEVKFDPAAYETKQVFYTSKDGTKVPMFITHKKGLKMNGKNPTLLYAYGGFNVNITPAFSVANMVFIENGGVYCVANLRGGGEYGEEWHKGGMLGKKQNVFDDFIAGAEYLIKQKYTSSSKLAIRGGSNGGLLIGACLTQRPDLFKVALPQVGVLDMLRYHKFTVGWGWAVEYGSSDNKDQFDYLIKYSPLHNIKKGTCYPATLVTTADHDDRVVPAHSFKFAAALQEAQGCANPTLIRIDSKAGHGAGKPTSKMIDEAADIWSFVFYNMGITKL